MLTIEDCIGLSELTEEEIIAIAEHEHIPEMVAVELGNYLVETSSGEKRIKAMIVDDIDQARRDRNLHRLLTLKLCLKRFLEHLAVNACVRSRTRRVGYNMARWARIGWAASQAGRYGSRSACFCRRWSRRPARLSRPFQALPRMLPRLPIPIG